MKKILYILCAMAAFASCSKEELPTTGGQNPDGSYTFKLGIEEPDYAPQSRATVTMGRYMLEMYEGDLTATPTKHSNTTGVFKVEMKKNTDYVCLFWADNGTDYTATDLKAVKQTDETKVGTAAYFAKVELNTKNFDGTVTLKRAVAELSFIDKNGLNKESNTLKITYPYASVAFNVGDGTVTHAFGTAVHTITNITPPTKATTAFTTDFVLAPTAAGAMQGLKFQLNNEDEKTIAETAIQANYKTKITGEYWKLKVGDFYYKDKTFSSTYTADAQNPCIGIVFVVNADGKTGKIVGLTEPETNWNGGTNAAGKLTWGPAGTTTNANDEDNGTTNMTTIKALDHTLATYPAFAWAESQNTPAIAGINWYLPAIKELRQLYAAMSGLKWVASGAGAGEINDWGSSITMPNGGNYITARAVFNCKFTSANGTAMDLTTKPYYWSSTETNVKFAWRSFFGNGLTGDSNKSSSDIISVRVVSTF